MALQKFHTVIQLLEEASWPPDKIEAFKAYCNEKGLAKNGLVDNGTVSEAVKTFGREYSKSKQHASH